MEIPGVNYSVGKNSRGNVVVAAPLMFCQHSPHNSQRGAEIEMQMDRETAIWMAGELLEWAKRADSDEPLEGTWYDQQSMIRALADSR